MKQLFLVLLLLCTVSVSAQDVIVKKDGSTIVCRVVELTESEIVYKKWGNLNGSSYVMERSAALAINYQNGKKVNLSEATNLYKPSNQNDGVQNFNDRALLKLDAEEKFGSNNKGNYTLRWVGGAALAVLGVVCTGSGIYEGFISSHHGSREDIDVVLELGIGIPSLAASFFLLKSAIKHQKQLKELRGLSLYQHDFKFNNSSSLSAGVDMITDPNIGSNTLGLGLHYNF